MKKNSVNQDYGKITLIVVVIVLLVVVIGGLIYYFTRDEQIIKHNSNLVPPLSCHNEVETRISLRFDLKNRHDASFRQFIV